MNNRRWSSALIYVLIFALSRGGLFAAPIILANVVPATDYGVLEFAQALASLAAIVLALGTSATVPLLLLRKVETGSWNSVVLHQLAMATALLTLALLLSQVDVPDAAWLACICTAVLMLQALGSIVLKSQGRGEASLWLDGGFWFALAIGALAAAALLLPPAQRATAALAGLIGYLAILMGWMITNLLRVGLRSGASPYAATLRLGLPLMALSLLAVLATASGRIGIGLLSTPEITAEYSALFRATALPIVAHQMIMVARYRQVFELRVEQLERKLPWVVALVTLGVVAFWACSTPLSTLLGSAFVSAFTRHRAEGLLILVQCILWSAIALNDVVNSRSLTSGAVATWSGLYFVIVLPLAWLFLTARPVELSAFVPVHSIVMAGYFVTQAAVMWRHGIRLNRTWGFTLLAFVTLSAMTQVL